MQGRILLHFAIFILFQLLLSGCAGYRCPTSHINRPLCESQEHRKNLSEATRSPVYRAIPRHRCQIRWYDLPHWTAWAIAGNDDDGIFGEYQRRPYRPEMRNTPKKALRWWARNPFHNLFHYVIGSANCVNSEFVLLNLNCHGVQSLRYTPVAYRNFGCRGSSFFFALHGWKPYIALRMVYFNKYQTDIYLGWRKHGALGFKFHPFKKREPDH